MGILGVIELFLGFIALASPWIVGASFIWVIGIMLMVLAVVRLIQVFTVPSSRGWNLVTARLFGGRAVYVLGCRTPWQLPDFKSVVPDFAGMTDRKAN